MKKFLKNLPFSIILIFILLYSAWYIAGYGMTIYRREDPRYMTLTINVPFFSETFTFGEFPQPDPIVELNHKENDLYWTLSNNEKIVYDTVLQRAYDIWNGKTNSLKINVPLKNFEYESEHILSSRPSLMANEVNEMDFQKISAALHRDYEWLLWFEGPIEWYLKDPSLKYNVSGNDGSSFEVILTPSRKFSGEGDTLSKESMDAVLRARHEIESLLSEAEVMSDDEKINFFKEKVLDIINYDYEALKNPQAGPDSYVNANSIISVFDSQGTHMVMCGGYSNAFQALCDLAGIKGVYTVVGNFETDASIAYHAWNIVVRDGQKYLYDITNAEKGSIGQNNKLINKFVEGDSYDIDLGYKIIRYTEKQH